MATQVTVQTLSPTGGEITFQDVDGTNGNSFLNTTGRIIMRIKNTDTSDHTVHIASPTPCNQGYTHDIDATVTAGTEVSFGPFSVARFNDENNMVNVTYPDGGTGLQIAVIQI